MRNDPFRLDGKVAVVTGSTRGLGSAFADALAAAGAAVMLTGRDEAAGLEHLRALENAGHRAAFLAADITVPDEISRLLAFTIDTFDGVDILVNNAGACVHAPALEVTAEDWRHGMDVNLDAVWHSCQIFGRYFVAERRGRSSTSGRCRGRS